MQRKSYMGPPPTPFEEVDEGEDGGAGGGGLS